MRTKISNDHFYSPVVVQYRRTGTVELGQFWWNDFIVSSSTRPRSVWAMSRGKLLGLLGRRKVRRERKRTTRMNRQESKIKYLTHTYRQIGQKVFIMANTYREKKERGGFLYGHFSSKSMTRQNSRGRHRPRNFLTRNKTICLSYVFFMLTPLSLFLAPFQFDQLAVR